MEIQVQGRNIELLEETLDYIEKKLQRIQRRSRLPMSSHVVVTRESTRSRMDSVVVEVTLNCNGSLLRAEERAPTVLAAVGMAADVLDRRVVHYKGKVYKSQVKRRSGQPVSVRGLESPPTPPEIPMELISGRRVVRVKRFVIDPMSVEEASDQMESLGALLLLLPGQCHQLLERAVPSLGRRPGPDRAGGGVAVD
jgi:putative sigma-54 modulation protein